MDSEKFKLHRDSNLEYECKDGIHIVHLVMRGGRPALHYLIRDKVVSMSKKLRVGRIELNLNLSP